MVDHSAMWPLLSIYIVLAGFVDHKAQEHFVVALNMKYIVTVREDVLGIFRTYLSIDAAISLFMDASDYVSLILPKRQEQKLLTIHRCSFSRWCRECLTFSLSYIGSRYNVYEYLQAVASQMAQNT